MDRKYKIVAVQKDKGGEIQSYKLDNDKILSKKEAVDLAKDGAIEGVLVSMSKLGEEYLRSNPDSVSDNNLDNLPIIGDNLMI
ncbi:DUF3892 domain-containing protein [Clostridium grantii]|jgi:hypothetical protein|uniref:DUF3892 domain-containing protein n=1 Tax=Clostridium grantii DSM 8605 TaxID=1121316 RepID=A0A1M5WC26_9CLOT|nr:DUF3892 domain-containing protein [Clostridium grantii]SHH85011.1 Protein of unknown function [Clostridium grantii DSM 8605]